MSKKDAIIFGFAAIIFVNALEDNRWQAWIGVGFAVLWFVLVQFEAWLWRRGK